MGIYLLVVTLSYTVLVNHYRLSPVISQNLYLYSLVKYLPFITITITLFAIIKKQNRLKELVKKNKEFFVLYSIYFGSVLISNSLNDHFFLNTSKFIYYTITGVFVSLLSYVVCENNSTQMRFVNLFITLALITTLHGLCARYFEYDFLFVSNYSYFFIAEEKYRTGGPMGNPIVYGTFLSMMAPFFFMKITDKRVKTYTKILMSIGLIFLLFGIISSNSRAAFLIATFNLFAFLFFHQKASIRLLIVVVIAIALCSFLTAKYIVVNDLFERFLYMQTDRSVIERISRYFLAWKIVSNEPLFGVGFGNLVRVFDSYFDAEWSASGSVKSMENQYLQILVETGLIGLVLNISLLKYYFWPIHKSISNIGMISRFKSMSLFTFSCWLSIAGVMIVMMTWDALNHPTIRIYYWFIVGFLLQKQNEHDGSHSRDN